MNSIKLGSLIEGEASRDAIHIAVMPAVAAEELRPGQDVGQDRNGDFCRTESAVGIVDPFLKHSVPKGGCFWLCLYPGTICNLRHVWTHPLLPTEPKTDSQSRAEQWLRVYAAELNSCDQPDKAFVDLISGLQTGRLHAHGTELWRLDDLEKAEKLKQYAEEYLGIMIDWDRFSFSCAC